MKTSLRCRTCQSSDVERINKLFQAGHSSTCVMWHLYHLGRKIPAQTLENHQVNHLGIHPRPLLVSFASQEPGWYWPLEVPSVPLGKTPELLLIRGMPGSGKSSLAREFLLTHFHLEADQFFFSPTGDWIMQPKLRKAAHAWCLATARGALEDRMNVVVANTFRSAWELRGFCVMGQQVEAKIRILDIPNPWPWTRQATGVPIPPRVSRLVFFRMRKHWKPLSTVPAEWNIPVTIEQRNAPTQIPAYDTIPLECSPRFCPIYTERFSGKMSFPEKARSNTSIVPIG